MPEVHFVVRWPDGATSSEYSPSRAIREHLAVGVPYDLEEFVARVRLGLSAASERVRAIYGSPCSAAAASLRAIETRAQKYREHVPPALSRIDAPSVTIERFVGGETPVPSGEVR
jgi:uncharacterized repeat protein (TIGR04042 family)